MKKIFLILILGFFAPLPARAGDIRDVKPPVLLPAQYGFLTAVLVVLLLAGLFWALRKMLLRRRVTRAPSPEPLSPPWAVAFQRLEALKQAGLPEGGGVKDFYTELSDILRRYMEGRFQIRAPEMTTEEFLVYLKKTPALNAQHKSSLQDFLNSCDMVKFARFSSSPAEMERSLNLAWQLVAETEPQP